MSYLLPGRLRIQVIPFKQKRTTTFKEQLATATHIENFRTVYTLRTEKLKEQWTRQVAINRSSSGCEGCNLPCCVLMCFRNNDSQKATKCYQHRFSFSVLDQDYAAVNKSTCNKPSFVPSDVQALYTTNYIHSLVQTLQSS